MSRSVNLGLIQMSCSEDIQENFDKTINLIKEAAGRGAQIICTQELFKSRYFCQTENWKNFDLAEEINDDSPTLLRLRELGAELQVVLVASLFEKRATGIYHNTTVVLDADGSYLGKYRKMHIPDDPLYYEKYYFTPGDLGYKVFKTRHADIGVLICWDQWFPEAARLLGLQGAEIIFIPTAIGFSAPGEGLPYAHAWQTVQQGHAVANACFLAAVNRVGFRSGPFNFDAQRQFGWGWSCWRTRDQFLGPEFRGGPRWDDCRPGFRRRGRDFNVYDRFVLDRRDQNKIFIPLPRSPSG